MENLFIGTIVSLVVQGIKGLSKKYIGENWQDIFTLTSLIAISFMAAGFIKLMGAVDYWNTLVDIGVKAAGIWALFIRRIE